MTTKKSLIPIGLTIIMSVLLFPISISADNTDTKPEERTVIYTRMGIGDYQNFLKNWDENKYPLLYALIQTPVQYDALFAPSPLMGDKRPFVPDAEIYKKEQILLIARVISAPENMDKVFEAERITEKGQELEFHYRFNEPKTNATYTVKNYLAVRIPKNNYKKITFFENGKQVGELKSAEAQWSVPKITSELNKPDAGEVK